jgi:hypothetical protein
MLFVDGLIVVFEKQGQWAESMTFTVAQPFQAPTAGAAPVPGAAPQTSTPQAATPGAAPAGTPPKPPASPAAPRP